MQLKIMGDNAGFGALIEPWVPYVMRGLVQFPPWGHRSKLGTSIFILLFFEETVISFDQMKCIQKGKEKAFQTI